MALSLLFGLLRGRRRGLSLLGGLLTSGLGAALLNTVYQHVLDRSREKRKIGPIASHDLEEALGEDRIQWLVQKTGMTRGELLAGLCYPARDEA
jgi:uncharacterized protein YidB (DUF937 family)